MAETFQSPSATAPLTEGAVAARPWFTFWSLIAKKLSAFGAIAQVTTANASDPATTQALVNELKAKVNALIQSQQ